MAFPALGAELTRSPGIDPASRISNQKEQSRLIEDQFQKLEELKKLGAKAERELPAKSHDGRCFQIATLHIRGGSLLSSEVAHQAQQRIENTCVTVDALNELLHELTQFYLDQGYITSRAYLPQQDLSSGVLRVEIVEGRLSRIEGKNEAFDRHELRMASPIETGAILNLRDLEQLTDQLNRLPSQHAKIDLIPAEEVGASSVIVTNQPEKPWRMSLGRSNSGDAGTGEAQWNVGVEWDDPLGFADQIALQYGHDADSSDKRGSEFRYVSYGVPYGYWTFGISYSESRYHATAAADGFEFAYSGISESTAFSATRLIYRDQLSKLSLVGALTRTGTRNYIDGARIDISSQRLTDAGVGLNYGRRLGSGFMNADLTWHKGLTLLGAQHDDAHSPSLPQAQYQKTSLTLSYLQPFTWLDQSFRYSSLLSGQWSDDVLYSPQRITLGGENSVRGFKDQSLSGDTGGFWRNEVTWSRALSPPRAPRGLDILSLTLAYDVGVIKDTPYNANVHGRLSGYALELALSGAHMSLSLGFARSLERPDVLPESEAPVYAALSAFF